MKQISFDFDGTLTIPKIQEYAKKFIEQGWEVFILTSRYDEMHKHLFPNNPTNQEVYDMADNLGVPYHHIIFTNMQLKMELLKDSRVEIHLDNAAFEKEFADLSEYDLPRVITLEDNWEEIINKLLDAHFRVTSGN